jgi:hypothetical protein
VLHLLELVRTLVEGFDEVVVRPSLPKRLGSLNKLGRNVVPVLVKHNVAKEPQLLSSLVSEDSAKLFEAVPTHRLDGGFYNSRSELVSRERGHILGDVVVDASHALRFLSLVGLLQ